MTGKHTPFMYQLARPILIAILKCLIVRLAFHKKHYLFDYFVNLFSLVPSFENSVFKKFFPLTLYSLQSYDLEDKLKISKIMSRHIQS